MLADATPFVLCSKKTKVPASKSSARRCLFGRLDHKIVNESLERELQVIDQQLEQKWDFDFAKERPLPGGRYAWSPVDRSEYVPGPYLKEYTAKPTRPRTQTGLKRRLNFDDDHVSGCGADENALPLATGFDESSPVNSRGANAASTSASSRRVQTSITAFYQQRKKQRMEKC